MQHNQDNQLLEVLTRACVLIHVSVRYWRATKKLNAEDLGLDPEKITELISLGHKNLLPKEALEPFALLESRTHALVEASTFPFLGGLSRFLPNPKLQEVLDRVNRLAGEFAVKKGKGVGQWYCHIAAGGTGCGMARKLRVEYPGAIYHLMNSNAKGGLRTTCGCGAREAFSKCGWRSG